VRAATPAGAAAAGDLVVVSIQPPGHPGGTGGAAGRQAGPGHHQLHRAARRAATRTWWLAVQQRGAPAASGYGARGEVFSNITFWHLASLARAAGAADRRARADRRPGTTRPRRRRVTGFLNAIGYNTVDAGTLGSGGRRFQFGTRAFVTPYDTFSDHEGTLPAQRQYSPRSTPDRDWRRKIR